jgi:hypothetical protein
MATLWKDANGDILLVPGTSNPMYDDECCCEEVCCAECTDGVDTVTATTTGDPGANLQCALNGATIVDQVLDCMDDERGGDWPVPAGTNYYYGDCPSDLSSYKLVVYCVDGTPAAFIWDPVGEAVQGTYTLIDCTSEEWEFEAPGTVTCVDCIDNLLIIV